LTSDVSNTIQSTDFHAMHNCKTRSRFPSPKQIVQIVVSW